ncbi:MAG: hypothetical protein PHX65_09445 [Sulfurimonas sp.]|uniref:hypothetical protein n=1 Tax=Sulfurimonas sp. TaxID=2022749 RepID=UPI0025D55B54|nr:hypothetical protein [Sulfurimonas sp.]MCK9454743.1 hypothetical protein [Sulfurimonas sp.]MDD3506754.1 hypothetical protein [Sulfurimonas sp.]
MSKILYSNVNILIDEHNREILVNPAGERFYHVGHEEMHSVFLDATLSLDENGIYTIEGRQTLYNEHSALGSDYEKLLCKHPKELIKKSSLFWLFGLYRVSGVHKREISSRYICRYKEYCIIQREKFLSSEFAQDKSELKNDA